jgi:hypothetical protein
MSWAKRRRLDIDGRRSVSGPKPGSTGAIATARRSFRDGDGRADEPDLIRARPDHPRHRGDRFTLPLAWLCPEISDLAGSCRVDVSDPA